MVCIRCRQRDVVTSTVMKTIEKKYKIFRKVFWTRLVKVPDITVAICNSCGKIWVI